MPLSDCIIIMIFFVLHICMCIQAIKRMEKKKQKSANQWQDRKDEVKSTLQEKISKRELNISARKKGIEPHVLAAKLEKTNNSSSSSTNSSSSNSDLPPAKRPRLYMAMKHKDSDDNNSSGGGSSGGSGVAASNHSNSNKQNRPGFEGKKKEFLNKPKKK